MKMRKENKILILIGIFLLIYLTPTLLPKKVEIIYYNRTLPSSYKFSQSEIEIPAIGKINGKETGVITTLKVSAIPGEGRTLTNIENLLFWIDTQYSIRVAKHVAQRITNIDISKIDLIYTIESNASIIEGQSAGAALTIATIAALENKTLNKSVIITGTINDDGSIGKVGGIVYKAEAAKEAGAKLFLVPEGQSYVTEYKPKRTCEKIGIITFCRTEYEIQKVNVSEVVGIEVKEVKDIDEALNYFFS